MSEEKAQPKKYLTAEEILAADDLQTVEVDVPEWGGTVRLRSLTGQDAVSFAEQIKDNKKNSGIKVVARCAVKEDGTPLFTEEQVEALTTKNQKALIRVQREALKLLGLTDDVIALVKND